MIGTFPNEGYVKSDELIAVCFNLELYLCIRQPLFKLGGLQQWPELRLQLELTRN
jgi:hypothetical protein